jgi:hypothetical protein
MSRPRKRCSPPEPLTEEQAIRALRRLGERWPKSLWLFAAGGDLWIMAEPESGHRGDRFDRSSCLVRQELAIESVPIPCDGGDW